MSTTLLISSDFDSYLYSSSPDILQFFLRLSISRFSICFILPLAHRRLSCTPPPEMVVGIGEGKGERRDEEGEEGEGGNEGKGRGKKTLAAAPIHYS